MSVMLEMFRMAAFWAMAVREGAPLAMLALRWWSFVLYGLVFGDVVRDASELEQAGTKLVCGIIREQR